jgi:Predicted membrane protein
LTISQKYELLFSKYISAHPLLEKYLNAGFVGRIFKFGIVGVLNTIVGYGTYFILVRYNIHYSLASLISQVVGVIHSYLWNRNWTFKQSSKDSGQILRFLSVYVVTYFANLGLLAIMIEKFYLGKEISGLISLFIMTMISFVGHNFWSFKDKKVD